MRGGDPQIPGIVCALWDLPADTSGAVSWVPALASGDVRDAYGRQNRRSLMAGKSRQALARIKLVKPKTSRYA